jgi:hypothetical protein
LRISNENLLSENGPEDMSANFELRPIYLGHIAQYAIQLVFTGTPGGNFKLQCSNDPGSINSATRTMQPYNVTNWTDILDSAQTISAAGNHTWNAENVGYLWVRVVWTQTSGSGSLDSAIANLKGV